MQVCEAMVKCLEEEQVRLLFGYPGAAIVPFYDALQNSSITHILTRSEQNAAHAASGYARMTGKCGVCVATSGPGATNLISGIASAFMDSIPMVILTGQVDSHLLGRDVFQEVDTTGMVEPFIKHSYLLKDPSETGRVFKEAFTIANTGRPGPVLIDVPTDVQLCKLKFSYPKEARIRSYKPSGMGHPGQVRRAAEAIKNADRPLLIAGGGVFSSGAQEALEELLWKARIPAVTTLMGIGALPFGYEARLGMIGMHGEKGANLALGRADLLLLCGTRVGDRSIPAPELLAKEKRVIHIDIDPAEIGKNLPADIPVVGDLSLTLGTLGAELDCLTFPDWEKEILHYKERSRPVSRSLEEPADPRSVLRSLSARMEPGSVLTADVGQNGIWAAGAFKVLEGRFLTSGGMGTMGYALPAAIGAKLACPQKQVIAVCGDGSFQMSMMELATLNQHHLSVKLIVFSNNRLGMVGEYQKLHGAGKEYAVALDGSPDLGILSRAYGIPYGFIGRDGDIERALDALMESPGPYLLEVRVDPEEPTLEKDSQTFF